MTRVHNRLREKKWVMMTALFVCLAACDFQHVKNGGAAGTDNFDPNDPASDPSKISFQLVHDEVFHPSCVSCHTHNHSSFDTFEGAKPALDAIREHALVAKDMPTSPQAPLTARQLFILQTWYDHGAPEFPAAPGQPEPSPEPLAPTFASISGNVFSPKCVVCHRDHQVKSDNGQPVYFESTDQLLASGDIVSGDPANSILFQRITLPDGQKGHMPAHAPSLSSDEIETIRTWILSLSSPAPGVPLRLDWPTLSQAIFAPKCVQCHKGFAQYEKVKSKIDEIQSEALVKREMPKAPVAPLTSAEAALLTLWIQAGAPQAARAGF